MKNEIKQTAKHTIIYSIGNLSIKVIGLLLLPLYTSRLTLSDYGKLGILEVTTQFLIVIFGLNIYSAMIRWCSEEDSIEKQKTIIFTSYISLISVMFIFIILSQTLSSIFAKIYFNDLKFIIIFRYLFFIVFLEIINNLTLNLLRLKEKSLQFIIIVIIKLLLTLSLTIFFIIRLNMKIEGIFLSQLIGNALIFLITIPTIIKNINFNFDTDILKKMFRYSFPLIFSSISVMLLSIGDRFFIKFILDDSELGIYSLAYKFAGIINMLLIQSFALGYLPIAYKTINKKNATIFYSNVFSLFSTALIIFSLFISIFSREIIEIFAKNNEFWSAYLLVPILALTFVMKGIQYIFSLGFHIKKKTHYNAIIVIIAVFINFVLNYFLINKFGIWGAALATLLATSFITIMFYKYSQRIYHISYHFKNVIVILTWAVIFYFVSNLFYNPNILYRIGFKTLIFTIFIAILLFSKIISLNGFRKLFNLT
ncbi:MAG: oligosaccharide flippase family protein [Candidatus Cloacimonetes bacterium]|nr:oligosaccharide flippase family protein [Candidatus Cloacimonadota bacterium]